MGHDRGISPLLVAQITDFHCYAADAPPQYSCDNNANVARVVARLNALSPRPDVVIATGDLAADARPDEYAALDALLAPLEIPLYMLPGNHDLREPLRTAFAGRYGLAADGADYVRTVVDDYPLRLVSLDTTVAHHHNGAVPAEQVRWLDDTLAAAPDHPTLVFMHHPPFDTGIWWMDAMGILEGLDALAEVVRRHPQIVAMVAGHQHRSIHSTFAGVPAIVCPAICYAVALDLNAEAEGKFTNETPGFMLHRWSGETLVSHTLPLDDHETLDVWSNPKIWPAYLKRMVRRLPMPWSTGADA